MNPSDETRLLCAAVKPKYSRQQPTAKTPASTYESGGLIGKGIRRVILVMAALSVMVVARSEAAISQGSVNAVVNVGGMSSRLSPNEKGTFPRVNVTGNSTTSVMVSYVGGVQGDKVVAVSQDGGTINGGKTVEALTIDGNGEVAFTFQTTGNAGIYRISLRKGMQENTVQLWVGVVPGLKVKSGANSVH